MKLEISKSGLILLQKKNWEEFKSLLVVGARLLKIIELTGFLVLLLLIGKGMLFLLMPPVLRILL